MNIFTGIVLYILIWWTVIFAILPIGNQTVDVAQSAGGWRGVPAKPRMLRKVIITTIIATALWVGAYFVITGPWLSFRTGWLAAPNY